MTKKNMLKMFLAAGALTFAWSCSDESSSFKGDDQPNPPVPPSLQGTPMACFPAWVLQGLQNYVIYPDNVVTDDNGNILGSVSWLPAPHDSVGKILDIAGNILVQQVSKNTMPVIPANAPIYTLFEPAAFLLRLSNQDLLINPLSNTVTDPTGSIVATYDPITGKIVSTSSGSTIAVSAPEKTQLLPVINLLNKCATYTPPPEPESSSAIVVPPAPTSSSAIVVPPPTPVSSSAIVVPPPTPKSSSSVKSSSSAKSSSSSVVKSSSSVAVTGQCPTIKVVNGGAKGSGWATRYWDCCKPSCSWQENAGGHPTKQCTNGGKNESTDWGAGSVCSGGPMATCTSQIPFTIDGCDEIAFAFAAVPASNGGQCGKCFQLTFTGTGKYSNDANIKKMKGKKLIVMATNIGGDVAQGQFDVMIPGGGVGMFNGCSGMGWGAQGEQYGGLLSDCEKETNYSAVGYASCLTKKCNSAFGSDAKAKEGCLFLATWMKAASNPNHDYVEVECPEVLKSKY